MMRGRILRGPVGDHPGLVMVDGQQHSFVLEKIWRSPIAPTADATVDVELSSEGTVSSLTVVPESQLAKEQAEVALLLAKEKGTALANGLVAKFGAPTLIALGIIALSWFFLTAVSYNAGFLGKMEFTFWKVLGLLNAGSPMASLRSLSDDGGNAGIYGFLGGLALLAPLVGYFWKDRRAELGGVFPLAFMLFVWIAVRHALGNIGSAFGPAEEMQAIRNELMKGLSLGWGAYLAVAASLYLAFRSAIRFLASPK